MTLLAPIFAWAALAAVPIVLLYLLKMKRQQRVISSTLLWQQTLRDLEANVPFQKLRASLLLILQILILALLILALMRPTVPSQIKIGDRSVLVIDTSGSMLTRDTDEGTRFDSAKALAGNLIDGLEEGQRMMILSDRGRVTDGFLDSKAALRDALGDLDAEEVESDCGRALQLAYSVLTAGGDSKTTGSPATESAGGAGGHIYLVSDGAGLTLPSEAPDLGDMLTYYTVGASSDNVGIVGVQYRRPADPSARGELFVSVVNASGDERRVLVSLRPRDEAAAIDAQELTLKAHQASGVTFERAFDAGEFIVALSGKDAFELDDQAHVVLAANRPLRVMLVSDGLPEMERLLARADHLEAIIVSADQYAAADRRIAADRVIDLFIFDRFVPSTLPHGRTTMFLLPEQPAGVFRAEGVIAQPQVFDWNRNDPVMRFVSMRDVRLAEGSAVRLAAHPKIVPLVTGTDSPLVCYSQVGSVRHYCVAFDISRSSWARSSVSVSFPILMGNILNEARRGQRLGRAMVAQTGRPWSLGRFEPGTTIAVTGPDGDRFKVAAALAGADFQEGRRVGFYAASGPGHESTFALNLASLRESQIAPRERLRGLAGEVVSGKTRVARGTREIWPWAALAAAALLLVEWWVYHRRIG
jgi:aerotolerance regulator-like protein/VWA domain-containing protein